MVDPISMIAMALAAGAAAGLKPTAEQAVKDAYAGLKAVIKSRYQSIGVDMIEKNPASESRRATLKEDLAETEAATDKELLTEAQAVLDAVEKHAPEAAGAIGIDLKDIRVGASLNIEDLVAARDINLKAQGIETKEDFNLRGWRAGVTGGDDPKGKGQ